MNKILLLQKRVLRFIYGVEYRAHTIPLFISANVLPVNMLYLKTVASQMHDVSSGSAPSKISNLFTQSREIHTYHTRFSNAGNFFVNKSRLNQQLSSFSRFGTKVWNCLPNSMHSLPKKSLNKKIHTLLLKLLNDEDDYLPKKNDRC